MYVSEQALEHEQEQLFQARRSIYRLLHQVFSEPLTLETYHWIRLNGNTAGLAEMGEGGSLLNQFFNSADAERSVCQAKEEYQRLFIGPNALPAPPWESVYRGIEKVLFDFPALEMRNLYHRFGLQIANPSHEADDHLVFQLEFMLHLIDQSLRAKQSELAELLEGQRILLEDHLAKWIPQFSTDLEHASETPLYKGAAQLLEAMVSFDDGLMKELISQGR